MKPDLLARLFHAARQSPNDGAASPLSPAFIQRIITNIHPAAISSLSLINDYTHAFRRAFATAACIAIAAVALNWWTASHVAGLPLEDALLRPYLIP